MSQGKSVERPVEEAGEQGEASDAEGYAALYAGREFAFDPMKDLNLPANYDEVILRFRRLQGRQAMEVLN